MSLFRGAVALLLCASTVHVAQAETAQMVAATRLLSNEFARTTGAKPPAQPKPLRFNEITLFGTHNSYHVPPPDKVLNFLEAVDRLSSNTYGVEAQLNHLSLTDQLNTQNVRALELDMYWDPNGGLYADPLGPKMPDIDWIAALVKGTESFWEKLKNAFNSAGEWIAEHLNPANWFRKVELNQDPMMDPGWKIFHMNDFDFMASCRTFKLCLRELKAWHDTNPRHLPVTIFLNIKDDTLNQAFRKALSNGVADFLEKTGIVSIANVPAWEKNQFYAAEDEVLSIFDRDMIFTPDELRGNYSTVEEAVGNSQWPYIDQVLGKFLFVLDGGEDIYRQDSPILANRLFFAFSAMGKPDAAFILANDATNISDHVQRGYIVRARADKVPLPPVPNDMLSNVLWNGAQIIMTEVPAIQRDGQNPWAQGYSVPTTPRCNPFGSGGAYCPLLFSGGWGEWSEWEVGACSGPLCISSRSMQPLVRARACTSPPPANGGNLCDGSAEEWANCPSNTCSRITTGLVQSPIATQDSMGQTSSLAEAQNSSSDSESSGLALVLGITIPLTILLIAGIIAAIVWRKPIARKVKGCGSIVHSASSKGAPSSTKLAVSSPVISSYLGCEGVTKPAPSAEKKLHSELTYASLMYPAPYVPPYAASLPLDAVDVDEVDIEREVSLADTDSAVSEASNVDASGDAAASVSVLSRVQGAFAGLRSGATAGSVDHTTVPLRPSAQPTRRPSSGSRAVHGCGSDESLCAPPRPAVRPDRSRDVDV